MQFTRRQTQVLGLIAAGLTDEEIAQQLDISPRTVRAHSDALRVKLNVPRRRLVPSAYRRATGNDPLDLYGATVAASSARDAA